MTELQIIERIRKYWRERGYVVDVGMRECGATGLKNKEYKYTAIRSGMIDGLPADYRGELAITLQGMRIGQAGPDPSLQSGNNMRKP